MNLNNYDFQIAKTIEKINSLKAKKVLLQFPDGLKPLSNEILNRLKKKLNKTDFFIYGGSNFGACDLPQGVEKLGIDLIINFGHNDFGLNNYIKK